ncbi:MAG: hypothetical protein DI534_13565 [Leifsonia xyli]|nr:MAG: hypothetical protein DI534_13565 [Leifsonia xyli]
MSFADARGAVPVTPSSRVRSSASGLAALVVVVVGLVLVGCTSAPPDSAPVTPEPQRTEPVPAPSGGSIEDEITAPAPQPTEQAAIGDKASVDGGLSIRLAQVDPTTVTAETPGEVSGTAVKVTVEITNSGKAAADVSSAYVNLSASDGTYGVPTTAGDPEPLAGSVAPGATARGSYVFMLPKPADREVVVTVTPAAGSPAVAFTGRIS